MGTGRWDTKTYESRTTSKAEAGYKTPFVHSHDIASGKIEAKVHETLDPKAVNKAGDHEGANIRESLDSDDHPESLAIGVFFDETGSMKNLPIMLQEKLPELYGLLIRKGYVEHPQVLFGAIGDAFNGERAPLQVGQFESDNRADENLENIFLEGMGGGGNHESYELAAYFMARHTYLDCFEKRQKKGYLFFVGDERPYAKIDPKAVEALIGDELPQPLSTEELFDELKERYEVFYLFCTQGSYGDGERVLPETASDDSALGWQQLLGQNALRMDDAGAVCETIALTIGVMEGAVTLEDGMEDLGEVSTDLMAVKSAGRALAAVGAGSSSIAEASDELPGGEGESGSERV